MHTQHAYGTVFFKMHKNAADRVRKVGVHARMQGVGSEKVLRIRTFEHLNQNESIHCLGT